MIRPSTSDLSLCWRGPISPSDVEVSGTDVRRLTNPLIGASGAHLTWPTSTIRHRCAMSEVGLMTEDWSGHKPPSLEL